MSAYFVLERRLFVQCPSPKQPRPFSPRVRVCYAYHSAGCRDFAHSREWSEGCRGSQGSPLPVSRRQPAVPPRVSQNTVSHGQTYGLQLSLCLPAVVGICCECGLNATPQAGSVHIKSQAAAEPCAGQRCSSGEEEGDGKKGCGIARLLGSLWCCTGPGGCVKQ